MSRARQHEDSDVVFKAETCSAKGRSPPNLADVFCWAGPSTCSPALRAGRCAAPRTACQRRRRGKHALFPGKWASSVAERRRVCRRGGWFGCLGGGGARGPSQRCTSVRTWRATLARTVHVAAAHGRGRAALRGRLEPGEGRVHDHRPAVAPCWTFCTTRSGPRTSHHINHTITRLPRGRRRPSRRRTRTMPVRPHAHLRGGGGREQVHRGVQAGERWVFTDKRVRRSTTTGRTSSSRETTRTAPY